MVDSDKKVIRLTLRQQRTNLPIDNQVNAAKQIIDQIKKLPQYQSAKRIALYQSINGEVNLEKLWKDACLEGKICCFPILNPENTLSFLPTTTSTPFIKNRYNILEPTLEAAKALPLERLDIIFMPLVAFDEQCTRLGMGGGYYDRTLAKINHPLLIGIAYEFQRQSYLVPDDWDIPMDAVITEKTIYWKQS